MNILERLLWRWQGRRKLNSDRPALRYTAIRKLGELANPSDFILLLPYLGDPSQTIRNATALTLREIIYQVEDPAELEEIENSLVNRLNGQISLSEKLSIIEVMRALSLRTREKILGNLVRESQNDLQYAVIQSLEDTTNLDLLDDVLQAAETQDLVLRHTALKTWYEGVGNQTLKSVQDYITPRLHYLIRAAYELQTDGEFLRKALSYSNKKDLPHPKAYPDFMIRYITELLGTWDYDPEAYRSLHAIMVPSYFTFEDSTGNDERPYIVL